MQARHWQICGGVSVSRKRSSSARGLMCGRSGAARGACIANTHCREGPAGIGDAGSTAASWEVQVPGGIAISIAIGVRQAWMFLCVPDPKIGVWLLFVADARGVWLRGRPTQVFRKWKVGQVLLPQMELTPQHQFSLPLLSALFSCCLSFVHCIGPTTFVSQLGHVPGAIITQPGMKLHTVTFSVFHPQFPRRPVQAAQAPIMKGLFESHTSPRHLSSRSADWVILKITGFVCLTYWVCSPIYQCAQQSG